MTSWADTSIYRIAQIKLNTRMLHVATLLLRIKRKWRKHIRKHFCDGENFLCQRARATDYKRFRLMVRSQILFLPYHICMFVYSEWRAASLQHCRCVCVCVCINIKTSLFHVWRIRVYLGGRVCLDATMFWMLDTVAFNNNFVFT